MTPVLIYDTETTGIPDWHIPSDDPSQPHMVQLGAILADEDTREIISTLDLIVKPDGWDIPKEVSDIHGITTEKANAFGVPEKLAVDALLAMWNGCQRVAHNASFDKRIIRIAQKRFGMELEPWAEKETHSCTMFEAKELLSLPKRPKLSEVYKMATGKELEDAHSAMPDAMACMDVYWYLKDISEGGKTKSVPTF